LLAQGLGRLQDALGSIYGRDLETTALEDVQRLDAFTQTAEILAQIANQMARSSTLDRDAVAMMISNIKLADVAARLTGEAGAAVPCTSGDIEVF
jgi:hypothetical protein